ncbi:MAG: restriction endonuclease [Saprospiraceae bacterium]|nr:MAG: restriction endonuclease [Saprospiraceae bacterium]
MAKAVERENSIQSSDDLVTPREQTRAGFIALALEKNYLAVPYTEEAKALKTLASTVNRPRELLKSDDLRMALITASGLSEKSLKFLTEDDKTFAIKGLIEKFLEPAGRNFVDELVYRYLLTKGDALGGKARNLAGTLGERKFLRVLLSVFNLAGLNYSWKDAGSDSWLVRPKDDTGIENRIRGLSWTKGNKNRLLLLNTNVPAIKKNVDVSILEGTFDEAKGAKKSIIYQSDKYIALGELKGGIDPAGADEHWKTANSALNRIRTGFDKYQRRPKIFFVGAAIEKSMAAEIYKQLQNKKLHQAANLTNDGQLTAICEWMANL